MADHKSALKRIRQTKTRTIRNKDRISRIKTFIKKFTLALGGENAEASFSAAQSEIERGVSKGVLHKNAASRKISRLHKMLKASVAK
ncbi:MAG: 30S ribosomal protein S20 [Alphaproteobacteria bacterium]|nr:30S ribosomal protein S20 [Alphaproteobacteria bacterium]